MDAAFRETTNLGTDAGGAVARATGQAAPLSDAEVGFRKRNFGFGSRRDEARKRFQSFDVLKRDSIFNVGGFTGDAVDTGLRGGLLDFIKEQFGETGESADERIAAAQRLFAQQQGTLQEPSHFRIAAQTPKEEADRQRADVLGEGLLRALNLAADHLESAARLQASVAERQDRKVPTAGAGQPNFGIT